MEKVYEIGEQERNNLMHFIDRVPIKGLEELGSMNEIVIALNKPIHKVEPDKRPEAKLKPQEDVRK